MPISYTGPYASATFVAGVLNDKLAFAEERVARGDQLRNDALNALGAEPPEMQEPDSKIKDQVIVPEVETVTISPSALTNEMENNAAVLMSKFETGLLDFYQTYFPLGDEMKRVQEWIEDVLTNGGSGLKPEVEDQIWQRERARLLKDAARATAELTSQWAARGYPLPPGALVGATQRIDQDARDKIAQSSRERAIEQAKMELENIRFAVDKAMEYRKAAITSATDYLRLLCLPEQLRYETAFKMGEFKVRMIEAALKAQAAQMEALELPYKIAVADTEFTQDARKTNLGAVEKHGELRVRTMEAAAQSVGTQGAAALNAMHASANFSGNEQN